MSGANDYTAQQPASSVGDNSGVMGTYKALTSLTPLIAALVSGSDNKTSTRPSELQKLLVQSLAHPGQPIKVTAGELMQPNLLGIGRPKSFGGAAMGPALAAANALPSVLRGAGSLANVLMPQQGQQGGQMPGGAAPSPTVGPYDVPQIDMGSGVSMDAYPAQTPVDISPSDLAMLYGGDSGESYF